MRLRQPSVSVIVPCFNQGATLKETIDSVLSQSFQDFEIVIVNDGSTDHYTNQLLETYCKPKTKVITTLNCGVAEARNTGIRHSMGRYILPLDADDRISLDYLARAVSILDARPEVLLVYSDAEYFGEMTGAIDLPAFSREEMLSRNLIFNSAFFRKSDFEKTRGYDYRVYVYEDWDFWLTLLELHAEGEVYRIPETHFYYRISAASTLRSRDEASRRYSVMQLYLNHHALFEKHGIRPLALASTHAGYAGRTGADIPALGLKKSTYIAAMKERLHGAKRSILRAGNPLLSAWPNPIVTSDLRGLGKTVLTWRTEKERTVELRINSPDGPLFVRATGSGNAKTGEWVGDGMTCYLQDVSNGLPLTSANTLATEKIGVHPGVLKETVRSLRSLVAPAGLILMYHRISDRRLDPWRLDVSPRHFAEHLEVLHRFCRPVPLRTVTKGLLDGRLSPRSLMVTFDDGYRDTLIHAKPLLERYDIPATVFVASGHVDGEEEFWWDQLERILLEPVTLPTALNLVVRDRLVQWDAIETYSRLHLYYEVSEILQPLVDDERRRLLTELREWAMTPPGVRESRRCLQHGDILALARGGLIEIGSHTITHPLLPLLSLDSQRTEIQNGKIQLEEILNGPVTSFAYPYGLYTAQTSSFVQQSGFRCACSSAHRLVRKDTNPFSLPRVKVEDWSGEEFEQWLSEWFVRRFDVTSAGPQRRITFGSS